MDPHARPGSTPGFAGPAPSAPASERQHALDGLRACAALLIVVFHLGLTSLVAKALGDGPGVSGFMRGLGSSGVELFFTLSAVVLLRPFLTGRRPMHVPLYFWRRLKRLWPPFLGAWVLAGIAVALIGLYPTWWPSAMPSFHWQEWASQAFIVYTGQSAYNFAWWTLTIEVMFYVLAPLLVALLSGRSARAMTAALVASMLIAQGATVFPGDSMVPTLLLRFLTFSSCFIGGMLLAVHAVGPATRAMLFVSGAAIVAGNALDTRIDGHIGYGLIYMAVVSSALDPQSWLKQQLSRDAMVWLGERSYSLFLTHFSVIAIACWGTSLFILQKSVTYFLVSRTLALLGSLVVACVLFELVESRFATGLVTAGQWLPRRSTRR